MKVAYLLSDLGGGTGHHLLELLRRRPSEAWEAEIVSEASHGPHMALPVKHEILPAPGGPGLYPIRQFLRFRQLEHRFCLDRPEILHTYFFWSILYGRLLKARGVVGRLVENREDMGFDLGAHEVAWLSATRHLPDRVICVSEAVRQAVLQREGLPSSRVVVVRNGIHIETPSIDPRLEELRGELEIGEQNPIVMMVANYDRPVKGVVWFLDAIPVIRESVPHARFVLLGGGKRHAELSERVRRLGISDVLRMPGFRDDVHRFYELADLSVLTSLSEGLSITILESMRHGVPVVATRVGGNPELVHEGRTGFLVPPRDTSRFAAAVVHLLRDRTLRERFGAEGRSVVRRNFNLEHVVARFAEIYGAVLHGE
jgi:glycosyltransferase involved in cell wall biosynthesis